RFVHAQRLDDQALHEVELVDVARADGSVAYYRVAQVSCALDRAGGAVSLRLQDGIVVRDGLAERLDALELRFAPVSGPDWERSLPYLVVASGAYPEPELPADGTPA